MKLLVLTLAIVLNCKSSSAQSDFLYGCFSTNKDPSIAYTGNNVLQILNAQAGADVFLPTENGLKLNTVIFADIIGQCIKRKLENDDLGSLIDRKKRDLTELIDVALADKEISLEDVDNLIYSNSLRIRGKRETVFPYNILQNVLKLLVVQPLQTVVNNSFNYLNVSLYSYYKDPTNITGTIQIFSVNTVNNIVEISVQFLTNIKSQINSGLDNLAGISNNTEENVTRSNNVQSRDTFSDFLTSAVQSVIVPLNQTVNSIIESAKTVVSSFERPATNNPFDNIVNSMYNTFVSMISGTIDQIQSQIISFFNGLVAENVSEV